MKIGKSKAVPDKRTSTTGTRPKVQSYYTGVNRYARANPKPPIMVNRKIPLFSVLPSYKRVTFWVCLLAIAVSVSFIFRLVPEPIIIGQENIPKVQLQRYETYATLILKQSVFNRFKPTLRSSDIKNHMQTEFPDISKIDVVASALGRRPTLYISRYALPYVVESRGVSYSVSSTGVVVGDLKSSIVGDGKLIVIRDESGVEIKKNQQIIRADDADFFNICTTLLNLKGRGVEGIRITTTPREAYIKLAGLSYELRVLLDDSAENQMATFLTTEKLLQGRGEVPEKYMDLRVGEKVFWK